jgi:hypothetical protein
MRWSTPVLDEQSNATSLRRAFSLTFRAGLYPLIAGRRRAPTCNRATRSRRLLADVADFIFLSLIGATMAPALVRAAPIERRDLRGRRAQYPDRHRLCRFEFDFTPLARLTGARDRQSAALMARLCSLCASRALQKFTLRPVVPDALADRYKHRAAKRR